MKHLGVFIAILAGVLAARGSATSAAEPEAAASAIGIDDGSAYRMGGQTGLFAGSATERSASQSAQARRDAYIRERGEPDIGIGTQELEDMRQKVSKEDKAPEIDLGDAKTVTGYRNGKPYQEQVFGVGSGQSMAREAAWNMIKLLKAAKDAKLTLYALDGFRTMAEQQYLYNLYGSPRAAHPGYSNHQQGKAMDFGNVSAYGSANYRWLKANGKSYGYVNDVEGEPWHWDFVGK